MFSSSQLYTVHEVAQQLRVNDTTIRRWIKQGTLPAILLPGGKKRHSVRIQAEVINTLLQHRPTPALSS